MEEGKFVWHLGMTVRNKYEQRKLERGRASIHSKYQTLGRHETATNVVIGIVSNVLNDSSNTNISI